MGDPAKAQALDYVKRYEAMYGPGTVSAFGAYTWDAGLLLSQAIPVALKTAQPGTREFRAALRDALEAVHRSSTLWSCFRRFRAVTSFQINELQAF